MKAKKLVLNYVIFSLTLLKTKNPMKKKFTEKQIKILDIAEELIALGVAYARENNKKIMPLCPFAKKVFDRKKEYLDVLN